MVTEQNFEKHEECKQVLELLEVLLQRIKDLELKIDHTIEMNREHRGDYYQHPDYSGGSGK